MTTTTLSESIPLSDCNIDSIVHCALYYLMFTTERRTLLSTANDDDQKLLEKTVPLSFKVSRMTYKFPSLFCFFYTNHTSFFFSL